MLHNMGKILNEELFVLLITLTEYLYFWIRVLRDVLDNEDVLLCMNLSGLAQDPFLLTRPRSIQEAIYGDLELLMESYLMQINGVLNNLHALLLVIFREESLMELELKRRENSLQRAILLV